jgi:hypothetical protein
MPISNAAMPRNIISDKLLIEKTGKPLEHWYKLLDKKGAKKLPHVAIFKLVSEIAELKSLGQWNWNLLSTSYEWSRGLKERGQREKDFEVSISKTIAAPVAELFNAWIDPAARNRWLGREKITIRKSTPSKSARITWSDGETSLSVDFYPKAADKSQVVVQHQKIGGSSEAAELKTYWAEKLEKLKSQLEKT